MKKDRFRPKWVHFEILEMIRLPVQSRFSLIELLTVIVVIGILAGNSAWGATPGDLAPYLPDGFNLSTDIAELSLDPVESQGISLGGRKRNAKGPAQT